MDATTKHILVPVDFSDKAVFGLQMAANLLEVTGGKVTVIHVVKGVDPIWSDILTAEERKIYLDKMQQHLYRFSAKYIDCNKYELVCLIEKGKFCETILTKAEAMNVSIIVMGTSTVDNIKKRIIGTNALRIVSEAKCPVITVKETPKSKKIKRIVVPLDISKESREKVTYAVQLALITKAEIFIVSAYTLADDDIINKLESYRKQVHEYVANNGVKVTSKLLKVNDWVDGVLNYVDEMNGDIILITTHQQLEIVRSFLGSFASSIIKDAKIPVISLVPRIKHNLIFKMPGT